VKGGSIIPLGSEKQYASEETGAPWEIRIYPGKDGLFTVYQDEGNNYNYEKGRFSTFDLKWDDAKKILTIGARKGSYPGMLESRTFVVILPDGTAKTVQYNGKKVDVKFE